eukprot:CAMPEP_0197608726 /NCGR_PEP_ID=MMETSP1326-20131121/49739_1 /TAXON_ID=1155430 /ORGANISM="Genus nov. species nov., Strain RCC2288" /LENGTH=70 /DNA_ID=CAMNT_0043176993 /DNA_START=11 /DNA_END=219 /DNA_ORIENTATION=-
MAPAAAGCEVSCEVSSGVAAWVGGAGVGAGGAATPRACRSPSTASRNSNDLLVSLSVTSAHGCAASTAPA